MSLRTGDTMGSGNGYRSQSSKKKRKSPGVWQAAGVVNLKLGQAISDNVSLTER